MLIVSLMWKGISDDVIVAIKASYLGDFEWFWTGSDRHFCVQLAL